MIAMTLCKARCPKSRGVKVIPCAYKRAKRLHFGSMARKYTCTQCGATWLTNTRPKGDPGAWDDWEDPSIRRTNDRNRSQ